MRKPLKRAELFLSVSMLCAAWGIHSSAHAQGVSDAAGRPRTPRRAMNSRMIVTGTSIRGAPPVGSNVITVGREAIEQRACNPRSSC